MKVNIELFQVDIKQAVSAELLTMSDKHLADFETFWKPRLQNTNEEDKHWDWIKKRRVTDVSPSYERYAIECTYITQGLMLLEIDYHRSQLEPGKNLVYLDYLSTAPWNRPSIQNPPTYRGIGTALFTFALERSVSLEYKGRVGLHALPKAEKFYKQLGMTDCGIDANKQSLRYFEISTDKAVEILANCE